MEWFRCYHGMSTDPKLHAIARRAKVSRGLVIGAWLAILETASQASDRGSTEDVSDDTLAFLIDVKPGVAGRILSEIKAAGLIENQRVAAWEKRQKISDDGKIRVQRHRAQKANPLPDNETGGSGNVTVTPLEQNRTEQNRKKGISYEIPKEGCASGAPDDRTAVAVLSPADGRPLARKERYPTKGKLPRDGRSIRWPPEFEAAWQAYPVRSEDTREGCYAHWRRHVVDNRVDPASIVEAAEAWGMLLSGYEYRFGFLKWCREALWNQPPPKRRAEPKSNGQLIREANKAEANGDPWDPFGEVEREQRERELEHGSLSQVYRDDEDCGPEGPAGIGGRSHGPDGAFGQNVVPLLAAGGGRRL